MFTIKAEKVEVETIELEINIKCSECGEKLEVEYNENVRYENVRYGVSDRELIVTPCKVCLQKAEDNGREAAEF